MAKIDVCPASSIQTELWNYGTPLVRFVAYSVLVVVASLSTSTLDAILASSFTSFGHETRTAVLDTVTLQLHTYSMRSKHVYVVHIHYFVHTFCLS